jgi:GLPGLI family protein
MKKYIISAFFFVFCINTQAQDIQTSGVVVYEYKMKWSKIMQRLSYLSREEKDRIALTWGKDDEDSPGQKMKLFFSPQKSIYTYESDQGQSQDGSWSWRQDDYLVQRDFVKESKTEMYEMLGKTYIVEDSIGVIQWRILNQIKDVNGYVCMRAETYDPIKEQKITAWFSQDIAISAGPECFFGLPGLIMELDINDGDVVIEAKKIEFKTLTQELTLPKMKGKKINFSDYNQLLKKHISESVKSQRNPYWSIRY